uniref:tRNA/rRNA methyltransferase SpoU type domain-containing protein n=2 Tax=Lutzomyia longipalpis TaxID=7200 RepID=A0A1B0CE19_LUTLO
MKGCTDPFDAKSLRGGAGAQFQIPIRYPVNWEDLPDILPPENSVIISESSVKKATTNAHPPLDVAEFSLPNLGTDRHFSVVIGGETHGVSPEAYKLLRLYESSSCLHIPISEAVESLN